MSAPFRCGDVVRHIPTGEKWVVAWCEGDTLAPAGWPNCYALHSDCEMVRAATDDEHAEEVANWLAVGSGSSAERVRRLYAAPGAKP